MMVVVPVSVTDEQLERIGDRNPGWNVELVDGEVVLSPTSSDAGRRSMELATIVKRWADEHECIAFDSSTGFRITAKDVLSPDAALIAQSRWDALSDEQRRSYAPLVPDVVIELISSPEDVRVEHAKCARWSEHGAAFVLALSPYAEPSVRSWGTAPPGFPADWSAVTS